jgi:hypothetical protein
MTGLVTAQQRKTSNAASAKAFRASINRACRSRLCPLTDDQAAEMLRHA